MNLYEAIFVRRTIRNFRMEPLDQKILDQLLNFTKYLTIPYKEQPVRFEIIDNLKSKKYLGGIFSIKAPYYLALYTDKTADAMINAGCILEQLSLYLLTKGIGSCFMELHKINMVSASDGNHKAMLVMPFGKTDQIMMKDSRKVNRLGLEELCSFKEEADANVMLILKAARLAPSAMNNQPWRFVVYDNRIHVFCKKERLTVLQYKEVKLLDIGIMLAHLLIAAEEMWLNAEVMKKDMLSGKEYKKNEYICTVSLKG